MATRTKKKKAAGKPRSQDIDQKSKPVVALCDFIRNVTGTSAETRLSIYGIQDGNNYHISEISFEAADGRSGASYMCSHIPCSGLLYAAEMFLETFHIKPFRPNGWDSDLDEHGEQCDRLKYFLTAPSEELMMDCLRFILKANQERDAALEEVLNQKPDFGRGKTLAQLLSEITREQS